MLKNLLNKSQFWAVLAVLLIVPALIPALGDMIFIDDEAIRALVALEMKLSDNYITSTIGGELYLKKPPLYNWIIASSFSLFGEVSEFAARFPTVVSLLLFSFTVFYYLKKYFSWQIAASTALALIVSGRILFYESLRGLIDINFSWLIFMLFMVVYENIKNEKYLKLFLLSYLLTFFTYLLKGLPSVVFLGITLLTTFIYFKKWKKLFSFHHLLSLSLFVLLIAGYYLYYFNVNDIPFSKVFSTLVGESTRRTFIRFGVWETIKHLFTFPFEVIFHFLPFTVFALFLIHKKTRKKITEHPLLKYFILILIANITVYWVSKEVYARYLIMFVPLIYTLFIYSYYHTDHKKLLTAIEMLFLTIMTLATLGFWVVPGFIFYEGFLNNFIIWLVLSVLLSASVFFYIKIKANRLFIFIVFFLLVRIGFNFFVIPYRISEPNHYLKKEIAEEILEITNSKPLYTYWPDSVAPHNYFGKRIPSFITMFHLSKNRQSVLSSKGKLEKETYYITYPDFIKNTPHQFVRSYTTDGQTYWLIRIDH